MVQITGFCTLTMSHAGVSGWTFGFETRSPDGLKFYIDPVTQTTLPSDKERLWVSQGQTAGHLAVFPDPTTFMIQDEDQPFSFCVGSRDARSTPEDSQNAGRRGVVDGAVINIGQSFTAHENLRLIPFAINCVVPSEESGRTLDLEYVGRSGDPAEGALRLRGSGHPVANGVAASGTSRSADDLGFASIKILPGPGFLRCEVNGDGLVDPSDSIALLRYLFLNGSITECLPAADCNGRDGVDMNDAIYNRERYFLGGAPPPAPFGEGGVPEVTDPADCPRGMASCAL